MERISWHEFFINVMEILTKRSSCIKLKTAALIVHDTQILSIGYNGTFPGDVECNNYWFEYYKTTSQSISFADWCKTDEFRSLHRKWSLANEIHAEANALKWISRKDTKDCVMYTLYSPCDLCAKDIIAHNIKTVYYKHLYKHGEESLKKLDKYGVKCIKL